MVQVCRAGQIPLSCALRRVFDVSRQRDVAREKQKNVSNILN